MHDSVSLGCDAWQKRCLIVGVIGLALTAVIWFVSPAALFAGYLTGYVYWWALGVGALGLLLLYQMTGGAWAVLTRPALKAASWTIPLLGLLAVPVVLGLDYVYPWRNADYLAEHSYLMQKKEFYLNVPFFVGRLVGYFVLWSVLMYVMTKARNFPRVEQPSKLRGFAAFGVVLWVTAFTFAAIDLVMSLNPLWYSTIYGLIVGVGGIIAAFSLAILSMYSAKSYELPLPKPRDEALADVANLLFAFIMLWTYFSLSQFLIIWSANLPDEIVYYIDRTNSGWTWVGIGLVLFHYLVPFFLLLNRPVKTSPERMCKVAILLMAVHWVEVVWTVQPDTPGPRWASLLAAVFASVGIGGIWGWAFVRSFGKRIDVYPELVEETYGHLIVGHGHGTGHDHGHSGDVAPAGAH